MFRIIAAAGPVGFVLCGALAAVVVAYLCGARGRWLVGLGLLSIPTSFLGILIHDLLDLDVGLSPLASTLLIVATTSGVVAGLVAALFANKSD
ncbi:MAG: hypothetical protein AAF499_13540 [Pseudomonadota bacterium]